MIPAALLRSRERGESVMRMLLPVVFIVTASLTHAFTSATGNGIVIADTSGSAQTNSPQTVTRFFRQGDVPHFAQAVINGMPLFTQCDVKNRWSDGSVKFAIVSFVAPRITAQGTLVTFQDQPSGNNTGALGTSEMLSSAFNFDARMALNGNVSRMISARSMLTAGKFTYWLQGPIVTAVIVEDRDGRAFDVNTDELEGTPLHPIFEAWFYPLNRTVEVGFTLENAWVSSQPENSARHQTFGIVLSTGSVSPAINLRQPKFTQFAFTRWRRDYWIGGTPPAAKVRYDFNQPYLESTGAYPNWNYTITPNDIYGEVTAYRRLQSNFPERFTLAGYDNPSAGGIASYPQGIDQPGEWRYGDWKGLFTSWDAMYFFSGDPALRDEMLTNADLAGRFPIWFREADHHAGSGQYFDAPISGHVDPYGRVISVNARQQFTASIANWQPGCRGETPDDVNTLTPLNYPAAYGGWRSLNTSHIPAFAFMAYTLTGKHDYLEEIQMQAAGEIASLTGCFNLDSPYFRQGYLGLANAAATRNTAWQFRDMAYAAYVSPDTDPEGPYFRDKLLNNLALQEGGHGIPASFTDTPDRTIAYEYGRDRWAKSEAGNPSPLGIWYSSQAYGQTQNCVNNMRPGYVNLAYANFQEHFMMATLGMVRQMEIADTKPLLTIFAKRYFHILLDPAVHDPYLVQEYVYPQQTANGIWISSWTTFKGAYCVKRNSWLLGSPAAYATEALGALSYLSDISVDGYTGLDAWKWLKNDLPWTPNARWSQEPAGMK
jgi:hypothetical protein